MTRFPPLPDTDLDADQRRMAARASPTGPYQAFLRAPLLWEHLQPLRHYFATDSLLAPADREAAILVLARHRESPAAFEAHRALAAKAGIAGAVIDAIGAGADPATLDLAPSSRLAAEIAAQLLCKNRVDDDIFDRARQQWGERGPVELIGLIGFFTTIALTLNVMASDAEVSGSFRPAAYSPADEK